MENLNERKGNMTFEEARQELETLSKGEHYAIEYGLMVYQNFGSGRSREAECGVYIHGYGWKKGPTWRKVLDLLKTEIEKKEKIEKNEFTQPEEEEMPDEDSITEAV